MAAQSDGRPLRDHLEAAKKSGADPELLRDHKLSDSIAHLWDWFLILSNTRQRGFDAGPLTFAEMESFSRALRVTIEPWEALALIECDVAIRGDADTKKEAASNG